MFELTDRAAAQIFLAAQQSNMAGLALRLAAKRNADGSIGYLMGFDEINEDDVHINSKGVDIVFASVYKELLEGTMMDFADIEPDDFRFIFLNPNDLHYVPPQH